MVKKKRNATPVRDAMEETWSKKKSVRDTICMRQLVRNSTVILYCLKTSGEKNDK